jgi:hypothetical protein
MDNSILYCTVNIPRLTVDTQLLTPTYPLTRSSEKLYQALSWKCRLLLTFLFDDVGLNLGPREF